MKNNFRFILLKQLKNINDVKKATGLSRPTLTAFYYERSNPNLSTLTKITNYLDVTFDDLLLKGG